MIAPIKIGQGLLATTLLLSACSPGGQSGHPVDQRTEDPKIVANLEEIVALRERALESEQLLAELGKGDDNGLAELALANAQIALARERNHADIVVAELRNIVETKQRILKRAGFLAEENRLTESGVSELRVDLLEAEIRLQRELNDQKQAK